MARGEKGGDLCPQGGAGNKHHQGHQGRFQDGPLSVGLHSCHVKRDTGELAAVETANGEAGVKGEKG